MKTLHLCSGCPLILWDHAWAQWGDGSEELWPICNWYLCNRASNGKNNPGWEGKWKTNKSLGEVLQPEEKRLVLLNHLNNVGPQENFEKFDLSKIVHFWAFCSFPKLPGQYHCHHLIIIVNNVIWLTAWPVVTNTITTWCNSEKVPTLIFPTSKFQPSQMQPCLILLCSSLPNAVSKPLRGKNAFSFRRFFLQSNTTISVSK